MPRDPLRQFDNTHLSLDTAEERGFIHRDYVAHCLRWSHIAKSAAKHAATNRWVDIGCGVDQPLARLLHVNKFSPREGYYVGVDINHLTPHPHFANTSWAPLLCGKTNAVEALHLTDGRLKVTGSATGDLDLDAPTHVVALEILEHVSPPICRQLVLKFTELLSAGGTAFISTPCYDAHVGAADNHINEMTYQALGALLEDCGLAIVNRYGTFASQRDYKAAMTPAHTEIFKELQAYYDCNLLAIMFAPLYPQHSRNCLWELIAAPADYVRQFPPLEVVAEPWSSSPDYRQLAGEWV